MAGCQRFIFGALALFLAVAGPSGAQSCGGDTHRMQAALERIAAALERQPHAPAPQAGGGSTELAAALRRMANSGALPHGLTRQQCEDAIRALDALAEPPAPWRHDSNSAALRELARAITPPEGTNRCGDGSYAGPPRASARKVVRVQGSARVQGAKYRNGVR